MLKRTTGTILSVRKLRWLQIHTKPFPKGLRLCVVSPSIIKAKYTADGREYIRRRWIGPQYPVPCEGSTIMLVYEENTPQNIRIVY